MSQQTFDKEKNMEKETDTNVKKFLAKVAAQNSNLIAAYIFGSYARGNQTMDGDIDIALVIDHLDDDDKFDLQVQLMLLASSFDSRIEPHPLSNADFYSHNLFAAEIKKTGIEIPVNMLSK